MLVSIIFFYRLTKFLLQTSLTAFVGNRDKSLFAIGYADGEVHLYRRSTGKNLSYLRKNYFFLEKDVIIFNGHKTGVNCLAFSEDGLTLASGGKVQ